MNTQHLHRLLLLVSAARVANLRTWISNNLDPGQGQNWCQAGYSGTGAEPASHFVCCAALTNQELRKIVVALLNMASITLPAEWDTWTRLQRKQWLMDTGRQQIRTATDIRLALWDNDGQWDALQDRLAEAGLFPATASS